MTPAAPLSAGRSVDPFHFHAPPRSDVHLAYTPFASRDRSVPLTRTPPARSPKLWLWAFLFGALCWAVLWGGWELFVAIVRAL